MKTEYYLFELIKSLSSQERKKITDQWRSNSSCSKKTFYEDLFDILSKTETYNERAFKEEHRDKQFIKNFSFNKSYLYNKILQSIPEISDSARSMLAQLNRNIEICEFLISKGLYNQSLYLLKKIASKALSNEYFLEYIKIINLSKIALLNTLPNKKILKVTNEIYEKVDHAFDALKEIQTASRLNNELISLIKENGFSIGAKNNERIKELLSNSFYSSEKKLSVDALVYYYGDKFIFHYLSDDKKNAYIAAKKRADLVDDNLFYSEKYPICVLASMTELLSIQIELEKDDEFRKYFDRFTSLQIKDERIRNYWLIEKYYLNAGWLISKLDFRELNQLAVAFQTESSDYNHNDNYTNTTKFALYYLFSYSHFVAGDYNKSLEWINDINNGEFRDMTIADYIKLRFLKLLILYRLRFENLLKSEVRSLNRLLKSNPSYFEIGRALIELITRVDHSDDPRKNIDELNSFAKFVRSKKIRSSYDEISDKLDLITFVESEKCNCSMLDVLERQKHQ
ncbi:MAG: hypothetical protein WBC65_17110 [Ignavibacteria bacterium]